MAAKKTNTSGTKKSSIDTAVLMRQVNEFLLYHCEKIVLGVLGICALWVIVSSGYYSAVNWQPDTLTKETQTAKSEIEASKYTAADAGLLIINYAELSEQIKQKVAAEPYQTAAAWNPSMMPEVKLRERVDVLPVLVTCEAQRGQQSRVPVHERNEDSTIWVEITIDKQIKEQLANYPLDKKSLSGTEKLEYGTLVLQRAETNAVQKTLTEKDWITVKTIAVEMDGADGMPSINQNGPVLSAPSYTYIDTDVKAGHSYKYRASWDLKNPNFRLSPDAVAEGVDTVSEYLTPKWSREQAVYVPSQTDVVPVVNTKGKADKWGTFNAWKKITGRINIEYFDTDEGVVLPPLPMDVVRGTVCDLTGKEFESAKKELLKDPNDKPGSRSENKRGDPATKIPEFYPKEVTELKSGICIADISPEYALTQNTRKAVQELTLPSKMLLLLPSGVLQVKQVGEADTVKTSVGGNMRGMGRDMMPPGRGGDMMGGGKPPLGPGGRGGKPGIGGR